MKSRIAVLGAGIQGSCIALELAARGYRVDLYDRNSACVTQASAQNEGKIHLGFVYANDPSRKTARMMVRGALCFAPLMRRWLGDAFDRIPQSTSFKYAVNTQSLLTVDEIIRHFDDCVSIATEIGTAPDSDYFGRDFREPVRQLPPAEWEATFDSRNVRTVFQTHEISLDPEAVGALVNKVIRAIPGIELHLDTNVQGVSVNSSHLSVDFETGGARGRESYDHVVNALWDGRLTIDASLGYMPQRPWLWRLRRNLRVRTRSAVLELPSVTNILGPFGDVANFQNGDVFLSWYPSGRIGQSRELTPTQWQRPENLTEAPSTEEGILAGLRTIVPAIGELAEKLAAPPRVIEGIIFAWGTTDIYDRASGLHDRYEIGVHSHGRYHSIDTGKYTAAPFFATVVADRIAAAG